VIVASFVALLFVSSTIRAATVSFCSFLAICCCSSASSLSCANFLCISIAASSSSGVSNEAASAEELFTSVEVDGFLRAVLIK